MNLVNANQSLTISSEQLSELLEIRHDNLRQSAKNLASHGVVSFTENSVKGQNGRPKQVLYFNKRNSIVIAAKLNDKLLAAVVDRWLELETQQAPAIPQSFAEALQLAADQAKQLELAAPKVAFVDNLVNRDNLMNATQVAQKHGLSARALNKQLEEWKVYNKAVRRARVFQHWFVSKGYGEMKKTESGHDQPMFTNAGEVWINEKLVDATKNGCISKS